MRIPTMRGVIDRRLLVNYRVDPAVLSTFLPPPFRPQLVQGYGIAGICLIRLTHMRPRFVPAMFGLSSENVAHRIAVEWDQRGELRTGVYIPRRDTSSRINSLLGGRLFPGRLHSADFLIDENDDRIRIDIESHDGEMQIHVDGRIATEFPSDSVFGSLECASEFFAKDRLGYSPNSNTQKLDALTLRCFDWQVEPFSLDRVESRYFEKNSRLPKESLQLDCALLMRGIQHEWQNEVPMSCTKTAANCTTQTVSNRQSAISFRSEG